MSLNPTSPSTRGLQLDRVVLLGRTLEEYRRFFAIDPATLSGRRVLDLASGVSSFSAEISRTAARVTAADPIYEWSAGEIQSRCEPDLDQVTREIGGLPTYNWDFYRDPQGMREFRSRAYRTFLEDFRAAPSRYVPAKLPALPFNSDAFDCTFVSYFLFVYDARFDWEFHRASILEIMRVTAGEARIYPLVNFEAVPCPFVERLFCEPSLRHLDFQIIPTDFEFLKGSNACLQIRRRAH